MALRNIRTIGDEILRKEAKSVKAMTPRTEKLIEDMLDTMYDAYGVGLAAPQVGILKRIVVIDVSENQDAPYVFESIRKSSRPADPRLVRKAASAFPVSMRP